MKQVLNCVKSVKSNACEIYNSNETHPYLTKCVYTPGLFLLFSTCPDAHPIKPCVHPGYLLVFPLSLCVPVHSPSRL